MSDAQIMPSRNGRGVYLKLPPGADHLHAAFHEAFPAARFFDESGRWYLVGSTAGQRIRKWLEAQSETLADLTNVQHRAQQQVIDAKRAAAEADKAQGPLSNQYVKVTQRHDDVLRVVFSYNASAVTAIKQVPGARWDSASKSWFVPEMERPALRKAIEKMTGALTADAVALAAERATERAEREEAREKRAFELETRRWPMLLPGPPVGAVIRLHGKPVVVENYGKPFRVDENMPSVYGHLLGHEGERVAYAYYRSATPEEAITLVTDETKQVQQATRRREANEIMHSVEQQFRAAAEYPGRLPEFPKGETLWQERPDLRIYGGGTDWVLTPEGDLWRLRGNGGDGDDFSRNNLPGTIAERVHGDLANDLAQQLRQIAGLRSAD